MDTAPTLLDQALTGETRRIRRQAFVALVASEGWRQVLAPHVLSQQGYDLEEGSFPDRMTFALAAPAIAASEEKVQRVLELLGSRFSQDLCEAVAHHMGADLVEHVLAHLRTAEGERAILLQQLLSRADPRWVLLPPAKRAIRQRLRTVDPCRGQLLAVLAEAGNLDDFVQELREHPPSLLEEWNALGKANVRDDALTHRALALLASSPEPLAYLLRLNPALESVGPRMMAAARPEWLVQALEVAIVGGLHHRLLVNLAELGVRLGGRPMAAALAWLGSARLAKELLGVLATQMVRDNGRTRVNDLLWVQRRAPSPNRALEDGRRGVVPDAYDAAALVRQLRGEKVLELTREILSKPRPLMMDTVLRPLCAVHPEAAAEVVALSRSLDQPLASQARLAREWADILWPPEPQPVDE